MNRRSKIGCLSLYMISLTPRVDFNESFHILSKLSRPWHSSHFGSVIAETRFNLGRGLANLWTSNIALSSRERHMKG